MERYSVTYRPSVVKTDIPRLGSAASIIKKSIDKKLKINPLVYGVRLRNILKGFFKLRVGDWRVIYNVSENQVVDVMAIGHRSEVYRSLKKRLGL